MRGITYVILSQICFALIGVFTKYIGSSINSFNIVFFRVFIASLFILIFALFTKSTKDLLIKREDILPFAIISILVGLNFVFFIAAFSLTSIIEVALLSSMTPIFVCFMASYFLKEKISVNAGFALLFVIVGIFVMNSGGFDKTHLLGNVFVVLSSFFAAGQIIYIRFEDRNHTAIDIVFWPMLFLSVLLSPLMFTFNFSAVLPQVYLWLSLLGVVCTGMAYIFFANGLKYISASNFSILSIMSFSGVSLLFGIGIFGEQLTRSMLFGGSFLIISALVVEHDKSILEMKYVRYLNYKTNMFFKFIKFK